MVEVVASRREFRRWIDIHLFFLLHVKEFKHHVLHEVLECPGVVRLLDL